MICHLFEFNQYIFSTKHQFPQELSHILNNNKVLVHSFHKLIFSVNFKLWYLKRVNKLPYLSCI